MTSRRAWLRGAATVLLAGAARARSAPPDAAVTPEASLQFPRDHGSHPLFRTEWWYVTGWLETLTPVEGSELRGEQLGFQLTFFRTRPRLQADSPSAFSPRQIIIAHAALSDPARGRLWKDQRIARAGFGLVAASETDTEVWLDGWRLQRAPQSGTHGAYRSSIDSEDFGLQLELQAREPPMLNGTSGYSQKGPDPRSASYYYSLPQLQVTGEISRRGQRQDITGRAWLDHEWSTAYLDADAAGWDWFALNLHDGGALMAFRIRDRRGQSHWAGATWRRADGSQRSYAPTEVRFAPDRSWRSPRTQVAWPVSWRVQVGTDFDLSLAPLMDDQESDTRATTGAIYWEGAVRAVAARVGSAPREIGAGYLELTGYGDPLRLP